MPARIQRRREHGWRMPPGAVYVGRPTRWGNPFPVAGDRASWMALAFGQRADAAGRRAAAIIGFRWWISGGDPAKLPVSAAPASDSFGEIEYSDGSVRKFGDIAAGLGLLMWLREPLVLPLPPELDELRGRDLVCWCPPGVPCHADVLLELANA